FINYRENNRLRQQNFTVFGRVVAGMEVAASFRSVGDARMGLDQDRLWKDGEAYLASLSQKPNMILKAEVVESVGGR
ncbi:MAG TPA: hypothetical protein VNO81_04505, partial [Candidatus Nitrosotenuis sp.]|nr:hypothetical protein [Candidatus Nitrosotenuis sp.]